MKRERMDNRPRMTPEGWRRPLDTERHHREKGWNYQGEGIYHITMVVAERYPLFGQLEGNTPEETRVRLNPLGKRVLDILLDEPRYYGEKGYAIKTIATQIMPDHIHWVVQVLAPLPKSIGEVVRGFKSACTSLYKREYMRCRNYATKMKRETDGTMGCDKYVARVKKEEEIIFHFSRIFTRIETIWEQKPEYYHERILHSYEQLQAMIDYVHDNPRRLAIKRANPEMFRIQEDIQWRDLSFRVMGNRFLLNYPIKQALHCSRTITPEEIESQCRECLEAAENGTVYISAAISEGEKRICRALREAGYPLVVLLAEGFPKEGSKNYKYYKPSGVYFEACAQGQLLLIEPSAEMFEKPQVVERTKAKVGEIPHESKRWRFVAMNNIAEELSQICDKNEKRI